MPRRISPLLPSTDELLRHLGERLRLARLRRRLPARQVAERAGMAPMTLGSVERGGSGVSIGAYLAVMQVLGIERDLDLLAKQDPVGRSLQDAELSAPKRTTARRWLPRVQKPTEHPRVANEAPSIEDPKNWLGASGFTTSDALAALINTSPSSKGKKR